MNNLELIYNTLKQLNDKIDPNFEHLTFADVYQAMPDAWKLKADPRPSSDKMADWQFSDFLRHRRDAGLYVPEPADIDLCRYATFPPQNQLIGSCGGESGANIIERLCNMSAGVTGRHGIALSGQFLYWFAEQLDNDPGEGTYLWAVCEAARKHGVCLSSLFPEIADYDEFLKSEPTTEAIADAESRKIVAYYQTDSVEEMSIALQMSFGVQIGTLCHTGWGGPVIDHKKKGQYDLGGHATEVDGVLLSTGYVKDLNSWGIGGDGSGHALMTIDYLNDNLLDARIIVPE